MLSGSLRGIGRAKGWTNRNKYLRMHVVVLWRRSGGAFSVRNWGTEQSRGGWWSEKSFLRVTWGGGEKVRSRLCEGAGHLLGNERIVWSPWGVREQWATPQTLRTILKSPGKPWSCLKLEKKMMEFSF